MSKTLDALALAELLPSSIAGDAQVGSAAQAIDPELHAVADFARTLPILSRIDELPEELIDLLAWQWHVDLYETTLTLREKRETVKRLLLMHRYKGTRKAVDEALAPINYEVSINEATGEPFLFDVDLYVDVEVDLAEARDRCIRYVNIAKPVSRHLRNIDVHYNTEPSTGTFYAGSVLTGYIDVMIDATRS
jgi:phage tail P2-like protein